ncbi:MAG: hypothetical protein KME64_41060 [Scytonematopsis contorta HA4267-MV1]|nr:hypothetical protein [Scytonematopsis contorta HA4267-MV1]
MKNLKLILKTAGILIAMVHLAGCGETNSNSASQSPTINTNPKVELASSNSSSPAEAATKQTGKKLAAGEYCYTAKTKTLSATARIKVNAASLVNGTVSATIQNPQAGYFTSYNQAVTGKLEGNKAKLKIITKIENDTQNTQETWTITESSINTGRETFTKANCATLTQGSETSNNSTAAGKPRRVKFSPGTSSQVVKDSVIRGERHIYLVGAKQGQQMNLRITSLEKNAVFDLIAPNGKTIKQEATTWNSKLPASGDYRIVVGGTRGNATYELKIEIK